MDVSYYKEQHRNYMVISKTEDDAVIDYQQRMLADHKMEYLLSSRKRSIDGKDFNYYDITSKLTLRQMYGSRYMDMDDIRVLFEAIRSACVEVDRYLLDSRRICLDPNLIYYNCSGNRYSFLYNVSTGISDSLEGTSLFMDYLLDRVSTDDNAASDLIYRIYDQFDKGGADVWDIVLMTEECMGKEEPITGDPGYTEGKSVATVGDRYEGISGCESVYDSVYEGMAACDAADIRNEPENATNKVNAITVYAPWLLTIAGIIGVIACMVIYMFVYLKDEELYILLAGAGAAFLAAAAGMVIILKRKFKTRDGNHGMKREIDTETEDPVSDYTVIPSVHMQDFISTPPQTALRRKAFPMAAEEAEPEEEAGQTVFFDEKGKSGNYKLYALDRKNKQHIELDSFPCTIGKLAGYVDHSIDHPSVSRMHARIDKKGEDLILSDLNSTNGLFLNGIRMNPNEQRVIEAGDEIRFGSLNYCLRSV